MKQSRITKLLLTFFLAFLFVNKIDASTVCVPCANGKDDCNINIIEESMARISGYRVKVPQCKIEGEPVGYVSIGSADSHDKAKAIGQQQVERTARVGTADGKSYTTVTSTVKRCDDKKAYVSYSATCDVTYRTDKVAYCKKWDKNKNEMDVCVDWGKTCPSGYSEKNGKCYKTVKGDWNKKIDNKGSDAGQQSKEEEQCKTDKSAYECSNCTAQPYTFNCPQYTCNPDYPVIEACSPSFDVEEKGGDPAYCINPSLPFSGNDNSDTGQYQESTFDATTCSNSYSSIDCGFSNILIEGTYYGIPEEAIELALRLWGAHSGQSGYDTIGLSNRTGSDCKTTISYFKEKDGSVPNVYENTQDYLTDAAKSKFFELAQKSDTLNIGKISYGGQRIAIECVTNSESEDKLGVACGSNDVYKLASDLFFNTLIGNKDMQDHYNLLTGKFINDPTMAEYVITETKTDVKVNNKTYGCDSTSLAKIEEEHNTGKMTDKTYTEIRKACLPDGQIEVKFGPTTSTTTKEKEISCDEDTLKKLSTEEYNQIAPYCKTEAYFVDANGNKLHEDSVEKACTKGVGCTYKIKNFALCDIITNEKEVIKTPINIKVTYPEIKTNVSVVKYVACTDFDYQTMYSFRGVTDVKTTSTSTTGKVTKIKLDGVPTVEKELSIEYICANNSDDEDNCEEKGLKTEGNKSCFANGKICEDKTSDKNYDYTVKDPSLKCIAHMKDKAYQQYYDYSDHFGVNTNLCKIYCSDEVKYTLAGRQTIDSGRNFKYDVRQNEGKSTPLFTSTIKETRQCVSEIYYSKIPTSVQNSLRSLFALDNSADISSFVKLYKTLDDKSKNEGNRTENLNRILYDLYNCNLYKQNDFPEKVKQPKENTTGNLYANISKEYKEGNRGFSGCSIENNDCFNLEKITYDCGAEVNSDPTGNKIGDKNNPVKTSYQFITEHKKDIEVKYFKDRDSFKYDPSAGDKNYEYGVGKESSETAMDVRLDNNTTKTSIKIPINNYALFTITNEVGFYNNSKYYVKPITGYITKEIGKNSKEVAIGLDPYTFPMSKEAYNQGNVCTTDGSRRCQVTQTFASEGVHTYYRKSTDLFNSLNSNTKFECYVAVTPPDTCDRDDCAGKSTCTGKNCNVTNAGEYITYRNVDTTSLFPNKVPAGSNWSGEVGSAAIDRIEGASYINDEYLEYSITLNPTQIKEIKSLSSSEASIEYDSCDTVDNQAFINCRTSSDQSYLQMLREGKNVGTFVKDPLSADNNK